MFNELKKIVICILFLNIIINYRVFAYSERIIHTNYDFSNEIEWFQYQDPKSSSYINPKLFGAKGDGIADDTMPLQQAINFAAKHGIAKLRIPKGKYCINISGHKSDGEVLVIDGESHFFDKIGAGLILKSGLNIEFEEGAVLQAIPTDLPEYAVLYIGEKKDITITGGKIVGDYGSHLNNQGQHGMCLWIQSSSNIEINNCKLSKAWGDCIYVGCKWKNDIELGSNQSSDIRILQCDLSNSRRQGISVVGCDGLLVKNCHIYNIAGSLPQSGIDLEVNNNNFPNKNCVFSNIKIHDCKGGGIIGYTTSTHSVSIVDSEIESINLTCVDNININNSKINSVVFDNKYSSKDDKICVEDCVINTMSLYSSGKYQLMVKKSKIGGDLKQPALAFVSREDSPVYSDSLFLSFLECSIFALYDVNLFSYSSTKRPQNILIDKCNISAYKRTMLKANNLIIKNSYFCGRCLTLDLFSQNVSLMNNILLTDDCIKNIYGYVFKFMVKDYVEFAGNKILGKKIENNYLLVSEDYSPIMHILNNEAEQYRRMGNWGKSSKINIKNNKLQTN